MQERPILFNASMVRAIREGRKTQTRRLVKPQPSAGWAFDMPSTLGRITSQHPKRGKFGAFIRRGLDTKFPETDLVVSPYGQPGDQLWVREAFVIESNRGIEPESVYKPPFDDGRPVRRVDDPDETYWQQCHYRATDPVPELWYENSKKEGPECRWQPSIHMPRWASRIDLEITGVRVERLQDISEEDAEAEGSRCEISNIDRHGLPEGCAILSESYREGYKQIWESINGAGSWDANPWVWVVEFKLIDRDQKSDEPDGLSCGFQHGTIECRGDGYCWDADADGYDPGDHSLPCPQCNTKKWLQQQKEEAESCSSFSGIDSGTGVDIWENAVAVARRENPEAVDQLLAEIGLVNALFEDDAGEVHTKAFLYPEDVGAV